MKALVTGGAGFIGSHLVEHLLLCGDNVTVLDDFSSGKKENIAQFESDITLIQGSICCPVAVSQALEGVDVVYHQAAKISVCESFEHVLEYLKVNVEGTQTLLEGAKRAGVKQIIFSSSCSVYGEAPKEWVNEEVRLSPKSPYAATKKMGEALLETYALTTSMQAIALRYFNVYGPRQDAESGYSSALQCFLKAQREQKPATIYGTGQQSRDFIHVSDVVWANRAISEYAQANPEEFSNKMVAFNLGTGHSYSLNRLHADIQKLYSEADRISPLYRPARQGDVIKSCADISKLHQVIGFQPKVSLEKGLGDLFGA